ncbi:MAG: murein biosynthesis integral membrane protein MurJ [bacterium]|nr:murein biosynthesis integral membrane protein MurJ [bacterium]
MEFALYLTPKVILSDEKIESEAPKGGSGSFNGFHRALILPRRVDPRLQYHSMKQDSLIKSTTLFSLATLISRILGLVRDACVANYVPAVWQAIFWVGFRIPSTFRQLFAEGALSAAFIPLLTRVREREGEDKAREVSFAVFNLLALVVTSVVIIAIITAPWFVPMFLDFPEDHAPRADGAAIHQPAPDTHSVEWKEAQAVHATRIMFPFLLFIAFSAWSMGILNTYRIFFVPALASAFFNLSVIGGCILAMRYSNEQTLIWYLGLAVILGGCLQYAVQIPACFQHGYFPPRAVSPFHPAVMEFMRKLAPSVFGLAIYQLNALITQTYFASKYGASGISMITYAHRLIQFPLGMVGVALASASFPRIAQYLEQDKRAQAAKTLSDVLKYLMLLMIPAAAGLYIMGHDIIGAIFNRGEFRHSDWLEPTYQITSAYCLGLFFYAGFGVMVRTHQAHHDFRTPVICGGIGVAANIALCAIFSTFMPLWSMALASALASMLNVIMLFVLILKRMPDLKVSPLVFFGCKVVLASAGMAAVCWLTESHLPIADGRFRMYVLRTILGVSIGMVSFAGLGWILCRKELLELVRRKKPAGSGAAPRV